MNKKKITLLVVVALAFSAFPITLFTFVTAEPVFVLPNYEPMDVGVELRSKDLPISSSFEDERGLKTAAILDTKVWLSLNDYTGFYFFTTFNLLAESPTAEIWVQADLSWPAGDPRATPVITQEMVDYLLDEFSNNIIARTSAYFGAPNTHQGNYSLLEAWGYFPPGYYYSADAKNVILVSNIRDDNYYDPTYPSYIAGFYSSTFEAYFDRNIISIDCYDWEHRVGKPGDPWFLNDDKARPNLYESTIAHEYQHLIHDDYVEGAESWMNEACSLFAEPLCGYELDLKQVEWFLATPDNSLTEWGDQGGINILADYGASFLWALFLTDHYGLDFMGRYVQQGIGGVEGVNMLLPRGRSFEKVFRDWRIANLLQTDHGKYGYSLKELRKHYNPDAEIPWNELYPLTIHEVEGPEVLWTSAAIAFGETYTKPYIPYGQTEYVQDPTGMTKLPAHGTDYIKFYNFDDDVKFMIDGDEFGEVPLDRYEQWVNIGDETDYLWWSGQRDLTNSLIATQIEIPTTNPILELYTYWDIEDYWDFGFVQVSPTGNWEDWTSLENAYTTYDYDPNAHPDVIENLPGLTGWSGDFITIAFDLSDYAGETIYIGFRYVTDWATLYEGWYLDDVLVKGDGVADRDIIKDLEFVYPPNPEADFIIDLVRFEEDDGEIEFNGINKVRLNDLTEFGSKWFDLDDDEFFIAVVSSDTGLVDYQFSVMEKHDYHFYRRHFHRCH